MGKTVSWNLPTAAEYRLWSKELVQKRLKHDPQLAPYFVVNQYYHINAATIVLYEFQQAPLLGCYRSVIFDSQQGIVLCRRSSTARLTAYVQEMAAGLELQRELARQLTPGVSHAIATGRYTYFATRSYNQRHDDWVALHQMADFELVNSTTVEFSSIISNQGQYRFLFENCSPQIGQKIADGLVLNHAVFKLLAQHLERLGWRVAQMHGPSLIDQAECFHPHRSLTKLALPRLLRRLSDKKEQRYIRCLARECELPYLPAVHKLARYVTRRADTFY